MLTSHIANVNVKTTIKAKDGKVDGVPVREWVRQRVENALVSAANTFREDLGVTKFEVTVPGIESYCFAPDLHDE